MRFADFTFFSISVKLGDLLHLREMIGKLIACWAAARACTICIAALIYGSSCAVFIHFGIGTVPARMTVCHVFVGKINFRDDAGLGLVYKDGAGVVVLSSLVLVDLIILILGILTIFLAESTLKLL